MGGSRAATLSQASTSDEIEIVERALSGDSDALSTLFATNRGRLYQVAFSLLRNREDAEDALQDGLLSAYVNLETFEGRARFSTWLTRIVLNAALMKRRRLRAHLRVHLRENDANDFQDAVVRVIDTRPDPEQACALAEARERVRQSADQLSPVLRSAFYLRDMRQLSTPEAARAAGVKLSAIKSRAVRARHRLADLLDPNTMRPMRPQFSARPLAFGRVEHI